MVRNMKKPRYTLILGTKIGFRTSCMLAYLISSMFMTRSEYGRGVNTFSPEGRLFQVEYAIEAIKLGTTAIGIKTSEGVVLCVEKRITSPLIVPSSIQKIMEIDNHVGCAMSGMIADANIMIDHGRVEATNHWFSYDEVIRIETLTHAICDLALSFSEEGAVMARPFGVSLLIAGIDDTGPKLYHTHPSGTFTEYSAKAIGSASDSAQSTLEDSYRPTMTLIEAETKALEILRNVMEEKINDYNVEMAEISTKDKKFKIFSKEEVRTVLNRLPKPLIS